MSVAKSNARSHFTGFHLVSYFSINLTHAAKEEVSLPRQRGPSPRDSRRIFPSVSLPGCVQALRGSGRVDATTPLAQCCGPLRELKACPRRAGSFCENTSHRWTIDGPRARPAGSESSSLSRIKAASAGESRRALGPPWSMILATALSYCISCSTSLCDKNIAATRESRSKAAVAEHGRIVGSSRAQFASRPLLLFHSIITDDAKRRD